MRDFFPKIGIPTTRRTRKPVLAQFPTTVYTDPECLQIIKDRDKNTNDVYVKEFEAEISQKLSKVNLVWFRDTLFGLGTGLFGIGTLCQYRTIRYQNSLNRLYRFIF